MHDAARPHSIEWWLADVRAHFVEAAPDLLSLFEIYAAEAAFGRLYIATELQRLEYGAKVLEVGAGSLLLSCQLVREGFLVTALEPLGAGFSHFDRMRRVVLERADALGCLPRVVDSTAEAFVEPETFAFAYSVNVMEHVGDVACSIRNIAESLNSGACYRFTCPNYFFPYEPHFNIPIFFSKRITEKLLNRKIFGCTSMPDPAGTWRSLNWINVAQVSRIGRRIPGLQVKFNRSFFVGALERIVWDGKFAERRSPVMRVVLGVLVRLRLHYLFGFVPAAFQPAMDCMLRKTAHSERG